MSQIVWSKVDHHVALELKNTHEFIHFTAKELKQAIQGEPVEGLPYFPLPNLEQDLNLSLSYAPAFGKVFILHNYENTLILQVYAERWNERYQIDIVKGCLIDHFFIEDAVVCMDSYTAAAISELLSQAHIKENGPLTFQQYLKIKEQCFFLQLDFVVDQSDPQLLQGLTHLLPCPSSLKATLFPYQEKGFSWLHSMLEDLHGCLLCDEMGLGKTMQVLALLLAQKPHQKTPALIIMPLSLLANWGRECSKFAPSLRLYEHIGHQRCYNARLLLDFDVVITSYPTAERDKYFLSQIKWSLLILDEAQNIKNPKSKRTKACKLLPRESALAITGTPFENHLSDIWSLIDFICPQLLGSLSQYKQAFKENPLGAEKIEPILSSLMLRRLVKDVAQDLPELVESTQPIQMSLNEAKIYSQYIEDLKKKYFSQSLSIYMFQNLRLFCTHPFLTEAFKDKKHIDPITVSVKYQRFCEIVEEIVASREKVLVFTTFTKMFELLSTDIPHRFGIGVWMINGSTPKEKRLPIIDEFSAVKGSAMLVLNPVAGGVGLNITSANHVIHYNLEWNPALTQQSTARAYRRGQKKTVFVYRLYYQDTIEQFMNNKIELKQTLADKAVLSNEGSLTEYDLAHILAMIPSIIDR